MAEVDYKRKSNKAIAEGEAVETFLAGGDSLSVNAHGNEAGYVL